MTYDDDDDDDNDDVSGVVAVLLYQQVKWVLLDAHSLLIH